MYLLCISKNKIVVTLAYKFTSTIGLTYILSFVYFAKTLTQTIFSMNIFLYDKLSIIVMIIKQWRCAFLWSACTDSSIANLSKQSDHKICVLLSRYIANVVTRRSESVGSSHRLVACSVEFSIYRLKICTYIIITIIVKC